MKIGSNPNPLVILKHLKSLADKGMAETPAFTGAHEDFIAATTCERVDRNDVLEARNYLVKIPKLGNLNIREMVEHLECC